MEKMPLTDEEQAKVNESNVYNDKYIGNFLSLERRISHSLTSRIRYWQGLTVSMPKDI